MHTQGRGPAIAILSAQVVAVATTFPWAVVTLLWKCQFISDLGTEVNPSWQILPYVLYLLQPAFMAAGFSEVRACLPCHKHSQMSPAYNVYRWKVSHNQMANALNAATYCDRHRESGSEEIALC